MNYVDVDSAADEMIIFYYILICFPVFYLWVERDNVHSWELTKQSVGGGHNPKSKQNIMLFRLLVILQNII